MTRIWQSEVDMGRRLRAAGVPLEVRADDCGAGHLPANGVFIEQIAPCTVLDLDPGGVGYVLEFCILPNLPWPFEMARVKLEVPWEDPFMHWIPDPRETSAREGKYWLPTRIPLGYERNQVINHYIGTKKRLSRGRSIAGILLGFGAFMPDDVLHGSPVSALLRISDQFDSEYSGELSLRADRVSRRPRQNKKKREPLLACPDPKRAFNRGIPLSLRKVRREEGNDEKATPDPC